MEHFEDPFIKILPHLDLHGETRDTITFLVLDFIKLSKKMGHYKLVIIHGRHGGVLRTAVHELLRYNKDVDRFYVYGSNDGMTIVELKNS